MAVSFDTVRKIALALDGVEDGTSYGTAALKVRGALFLRLKEGGDSLVVRTDFDHREALIAEDPGVYYITDHYLNIRGSSSASPASIRTQSETSSAARTVSPAPRPGTSRDPNARHDVSPSRWPGR